MKRNACNMTTAFTIHQKLVAKGIERRMLELQQRADDIKRMSGTLPDDIDISDDAFKTFECEIDRFVNDAKNAFDYKGLADLGYTSYKEEKGDSNEVI